ncbi:MAG TPA: hypothetical protein VLW06_15895 [Terriglobales bacterium]|nr:hypothetical protein [Terriglobales bacterium]
MPAQAARTVHIPLWVKLVWTSWILVWVPVYFRQYGAQNFIFFCDIGNILITLALWLESPLIFSWQAVGLLIFQTLYTIDLISAFFFGHHIVGGTEYMFNPKVSLLVRLLGLYHVVVPPLLLWAVHRLGYDERAWKLQTLTCWIIVPINFFWRSQYNVNWARGLGHEQHLVPAWLYLLAYLIVVPLLIYWPTHLVLKCWMRAKAASK